MWRASDRIRTRKRPQQATEVASHVSRLNELLANEDDRLLDTTALKNAIVDGERVGVDESLLKSARTKLALVSQQQRLVRSKEATENLRDLVSSQPCTLDEWWVAMAALRKYIAMGEEADCDDGLLRMARKKLRDGDEERARLASERRDGAIATLQRLMEVSPTNTNTAELRIAIGEGLKTGVSQVGEHVLEILSN